MLTRSSPSRPSLQPRIPSKSPSRRGRPSQQVETVALEIEDNMDTGVAAMSIRNGTVLPKPTTAKRAATVGPARGTGTAARTPTRAKKVQSEHAENMDTGVAAMPMSIRNGTVLPKASAVKKRAGTVVPARGAAAATSTPSRVKPAQLDIAEDIDAGLAGMNIRNGTVLPKAATAKRAGTVPSRGTGAATGTPSRVTGGRGEKNKENVVADDDDEEDEGGQFRDELGSLYTCAAENYFLQGKAVQMNAAKRKGKRGKKGLREDPLNNLSEDEGDADDAAGDSPYSVCDLAALREYAEISSKLIPKQLTNVVDEVIENDFPKWKLYLAAKFNLLIHGVGSKEKLLDQFRERHFKGYSTMTISGYREEATVKNILAAIDESFRIKVSVCDRRNVLRFAECLAKGMVRQHLNLILFINNIDGAHMREPADQDALRVLAQSPNIRIVATIDHVNATLLWNTRQMTQFNWIHKKVDTYEVPLKELLAGQSRLLGLNPKSSQSTHSLSSLDALWQSLAANSQKIFVIFFSMCMAKAQPQSVPFWDLFDAARKSFLVSTDTALRQQLVEFEDHRVLSRRRREDGNEQLSPSLDRALVEKFLAEKGIALATEAD